MNSARWLLLAFLAPLACAQSVDPSSEEATEDTSSALLAHSKTLWPTRDGAAIVRVCWRPLNLGTETFSETEYAPDLDAVMIERRQWIREIIEEQWNGKTVMKFVGWKPCGEEPVDVEIDPISSDVVPREGCGRGQSCVDDFGARGRGKAVHINVLFGDEVLYSVRYKRAKGQRHDPNEILKSFVPALCLPEARAATQDPSFANEKLFVAEWKRCFQLNALHEFGHVAGFAHEWYRKDDEAKRQECMDDQSVDDLPSSMDQGDTPLGPFDSESVMSYCRHEKAAMLTQNDIEQTNAVYGSLAPKGDTGVTEGPPGSGSAKLVKSKEGTAASEESARGCNR
ncbi:MAG TPA: hypothetical protein VM925_20985 [Labilithrix sp.]|nr:hypothetical protein [Labilithrix sp.]